MSELDDAVSWRGPQNVSFLLYGTWPAGAIDDASCGFIIDCQWRLKTEAF
jgi:hypothetical protein